MDQVSQDDRTESRNEGEEAGDSCCDTKTPELRIVESGTEDESLRSNGVFDVSDKISQLEESCSLDPEVSSHSAQGNLHQM